MNILSFISALTNIKVTTYGLALLPSCAAADPDWACLGLTIETMIRYLLALAGAMCVFFIISGAFDYVGGWKIEMKQAGKNKINYAIGGLVIVTLSWLTVNTIVNWIFNF